jgi:hypothetical protein
VIELARSLEAQARARFVRWDPALWAAVLAGPADTLAAGLDATVGLAGRAALESYLRLCCEGVGLGYLYPAATGRVGFLNLAFLELVPRLLPAVPAGRQATLLAALWNLGENLELAAPWLRRIFERRFAGLAGLADLEAQVAAIEAEALTAPRQNLGPRPALRWVALGAEDRRFLPGALHWVAPTVVCVHDRARAGASLGVWLADPPLVLGPMGCSAAPTPARLWRPPRVADRRYSPPFASAANTWRGAATLVTSQALVCWMPEERR